MAAKSLDQTRPSNHRIFILWPVDDNPNFVTRPSDWDAAALAPFEQALARAVGPLAKVLVRRAAQRCPDAASLIAAVATHIDDAEERAAFLKRAGVTPGTRR